ncbi:hypothetical protein [Pseudomonas mangiferae]|uniref:Uncharacterized protein n=1 Tax=Pseudomonas mangiferae TaxID=2593654 RepID=A0A553H1G8_9PSED|nr:hypothetical protein [Pseudomonas mangiferae]TRX75573.1 hypothetical protein FM069_07465 [Pseudomonas mangiferae]
MNVSNSHDQRFAAFRFVTHGLSLAEHIHVRIEPTGGTMVEMVLYKKDKTLRFLVPQVKLNDAVELRRVILKMSQAPDIDDDYQPTLSKITEPPINDPVF